MCGLSESFIIRSEKGTTLGHPEMKIAIVGQLSGLLAFFFLKHIHCLDRSCIAVLCLTIGIISSIEL